MLFSTCFQKRHCNDNYEKGQAKGLLINKDLLLIKGSSYKAPR